MPAFNDLLREVSPERPVLIAGPTACGKSALALEIATAQGGVIVNADASQVYDCWRVITARPSKEDEAAAPHALYGHVAATQTYSTGHWLREVIDLLETDIRPIITGGTGLNFAALTQGLAQIPPTPPAIRTEADGLPLASLQLGLDAPTATRLDMANRARVQRAWEVLTATGRGLAAWQDDTGPPALSLDQTAAFYFDADRDWLNARIARRFDLMLRDGALAEIAAVAPTYDPTLPAHRAIGVPELMAHLEGTLTLEDAREAAITATRQYAKRQRTWMRSKMRAWRAIAVG